MDQPDDLYSMIRRLYSDSQVEQLLRGPRDEPPTEGDEGLAEVRFLLAVLRQPTSPEELDGQDQVVARVAASVRASQPITAPERTPVLTRRPRRVAVLATATTLFFASAAAAATSSLPAPLQRTVSSSLGHLGIRVPRPDSEPNQAAAMEQLPDEPTTIGPAGSEEPESEPPEAPVIPTTISSSESTNSSVPDDEPALETGPIGPDPSGPALNGLCTAWAAITKGGSAAPASVAFANLEAAALAAHRSVAEFCELTPAGRGSTGPPGSIEGSHGPGAELPTSGTQTPNGAVEPAPGSEPGGRSKPASPPSDTAPGKAASPPSDTAPGKPTSPPSDTAPGKPTSPPSDTAPGKPTSPPSDTAPGKGHQGPKG